MIANPESRTKQKFERESKLACQAEELEQKGLTQKEIAKLLNISRSYVSRIETKAIGKLAKEIKE